MLDPPRLLRIFSETVSELQQELQNLTDWGPSGKKAGQYTHDVVADKIVLGRLHSEGLSVLSEESGLSYPETNKDPQLTVVVDPVDGSTNASRRIPWYATSLCAVDSQGPLAALVVNLATGHSYQAIRSEGATEGPFRDEQINSKTLVPSANESLSRAIVATNGKQQTAIAAQRSWRQTRVLGAVALDLCSVASGSLDGFVDFDNGHGVWDYLGAYLICHEAGAVVSEASGLPLVVLDPLAKRSIVAGCNEPVHDALKKVRQPSA